MAHGTSNIDGHGFVVRNVPSYLDEACKAAPSAVYKSRKAAENKADREAAWAAAQVPDQVEGVVAAEIEGFPGYWFLVWIYTDEQAAHSVERETRQANQRAEQIRRASVRA